MCLFDSPLDLDFPAYNGAEGLAEHLKQLIDLLGITDTVDSHCLDEEAEAWKCVFGEYILKYLTYPSVIFADLYDTRQLTIQLGDTYGSVFDWDSLTTAEQEYCDSYADQTRDYLDAYTFPEVEPVNGYKGSIFSPSCGNYRFTMDASYYDYRTGTSSIEVGLAATFANTIMNDAIALYFAEDGQTNFENYNCFGKIC